jgi:hypothetical protein
MAGKSVALSGGGRRAALFGLAALLYLSDAGVNSSVSGDWAPYLLLAEVVGGG